MGRREREMLRELHTVLDGFGRVSRSIRFILGRLC